MRTVLGLALICSGCSSPLAPGKSAFEHGEFPEARRELVALERRYCDYDLELRAEYALYRGLTELALGHASFAALWLGRAKWLLDYEPELFDVDARGRLLAAWQSLGFMPGEPGRLRVVALRCAT
jgi:hypothetical protein